MENMQDKVVEHIKQLLADGVEASQNIHAISDIHESDRVVSIVCGYLSAANALLQTVPHMRNKMIDLPEFFLLRSISRTYHY